MVTSPIKIRKKQITDVCFYIATIAGCFVLPAILEIFLCGLFLIYFMIRGNNATVENNGKDAAFFLVFPVFLSCVQNLYLGLSVNHLKTFELQILLTLNVIIAIALPSMKLIVTKTIQDYKWCIVCIVGILTVSVISLAFTNVPIVSLISCLRNILAPFIFFYFGVVFGKYVNEKTFRKYIFSLITFVLIYGFIEYSLGNLIWSALNINKLWNLKGIATPNEFPSNWYSSEVIFGRAYIRRMASCFADPVNLGTFLFAAFMLCWYYRKYVLMTITIICCVLTISKGALLGFLIFGVIFLWYKDKTRITTVVSATGALVVGMAVLKFGAGSSTGLHVTMFLRSLKVPLVYPFGMGVGSVGVLAGITGGKFNIEIMETGIGVVIAQLGVIGEIAYLFLFYKMMKIPQNAPKNDKIFLYTLIFAFFSNAMFNEVALSPNSCGLYFILLGLWQAKLALNQNSLSSKISDVSFCIY